MVRYQAALRSVRARILCLEAMYVNASGCAGSLLSMKVYNHHSNKLIVRGPDLIVGKELFDPAVLIFTGSPYGSGTAFWTIRSNTFNSGMYRTEAYVNNIPIQPVYFQIK